MSLLTFSAVTALYLSPVSRDWSQLGSKESPSRALSIRQSRALWGHIGPAQMIDLCSNVSHGPPRPGTAISYIMQTTSCLPLIE